MQADIELAPRLTIKGIETPRCIVAFQDDHIPACEGETDACGESCHPGTDDDDFIVFSVAYGRHDPCMKKATVRTVALFKVV
jgi:hypothetical protein